METPTCTADKDNCFLKQLHLALRICRDDSANVGLKRALEAEPRFRNQIREGMIPERTASPASRQGRRQRNDLLQLPFDGDGRARGPSGSGCGHRSESRPPFPRSIRSGTSRASRKPDVVARLTKTVSGMPGARTLPHVHRDQNIKFGLSRRSLAHGAAIPGQSVERPIAGLILECIDQHRCLLPAIQRRGNCGSETDVRGMRRAC